MLAQSVDGNLRNKVEKGLVEKKAGTRETIRVHRSEDLSWFMPESKAERHTSGYEMSVSCSLSARFNKAELWSTERWCSPMCRQFEWRGQNRKYCTADKEVGVILLSEIVRIVCQHWRSTNCVRFITIATPVWSINSLNSKTQQQVWKLYYVSVPKNVKTQNNRWILKLDYSSVTWCFMPNPNRCLKL